MGKSYSEGDREYFPGDYYKYLFFLSDLQVLKVLKHIFIRYSETIPAAYGEGSFGDIRLKSFKKPLGSNQLRN